MLRSLFFSSLVLAHSQFLASGQAQTLGEDLAQTYMGVLLGYDVYPPITDDSQVWMDNSTWPIEVIVGTYIISIDDISPGLSEFTLTSQVFLYWRNSDCNQTSLHRDACDTRLNLGNGLRFLRSTSTKGTPSLTTALYVPDIHKEVFERKDETDVQPDAELVAGQTTFTHRFDMRDFPYEFHRLRVSLVSVYTDNVVRLTSFALDPAALEPTVPPGWTLRGIQCQVGESARGQTAGAVTSRPFHTYDCLIEVSRTNPSWWMTSFLLFAGILIMSFIGSLGVMAHEVAESRDDKDAARRALFSGTRLMGTYTIGLVLTYVFQVQVSPYGVPVENWPSMPTSTMIYVLGLLALLVLSFSGMIGSIVFKMPLVRQGFRGHFYYCYEIDKLPVEGQMDEAEQPLLLKKYCPEAEQARSEKTDQEGEGVAVEGGAEEAPPSSIARGRKSNQKNYNVLSLEEAIMVNRYVRQLLFLKVGVFVSVLVCALSILLTAKGRYDDAVAAASQGIKAVT